MSRPGEHAAEAEDWLVHLYSGEATPEDHEAFRGWLRESEDNARAYRRAEQAWRDLSIAAAGLGESRAETAQKPRRPYFRAIAAALPLILIGGILLQLFLSGQETVERYASKVGEITTVELADGSLVTLGGDTRLTARLGKRSRRVELASGGAYFDVARDEERPFRVLAGDAEVTVLGTQFDVRMGPDDVRVGVAEGVISLAPAQDGGADAPVRLEAGWQMRVSDAGFSQKTQVDEEHLTAWREGRFVFVDERLADIIAEINRYRNMKVVLADDSLKDIRVTISLPVKKTDQLLTALRATEPVEIVDLPSRIEIRPEK